MSSVGRAFLLVFASGCMVAVPQPDRTVSLGTTSSGSLIRGVQLPESGPGFVRARRGESTRFGTPELVGTLTRAFASVDARFAGTRPTRAGDLSGPGGGRHARHHSHRTGRDADILFYLVDAEGRSVDTLGFVAFSRFGHAVHEGATYFFDDARNWWLVRSLLLDREAPVQWIFVSRGLKARLLRHAMENEEDPRALVRAAYVLQQPTNGRAHDDHFHVRLYCSAVDRAAGCRDLGPRWSWLRPEVEEVAGEAGPGLDDGTLIAALLDGEDPAAR